MLRKHHKRGFYEKEMTKEVGKRGWTGASLKYKDHPCPVGHLAN